jgi:hypothetical protein
MAGAGCVLNGAGAEGDASDLPEKGDGSGGAQDAKGAMPQVAFFTKWHQFGLLISTSHRAGLGSGVHRAFGC